MAVQEEELVMVAWADQVPGQSSVRLIVYLAVVPYTFNTTKRIGTKVVVVLVPVT
jgi:hypothetical protein